MAAADISQCSTSSQAAANTSRHHAIEVVCEIPSRHDSDSGTTVRFRGSLCLRLIYGATLHHIRPAFKEFDRD